MNDTTITTTTLQENAQKSVLKRNSINRSSSISLGSRIPTKLNSSINNLHFSSTNNLNSSNNYLPSRLPQISPRSPRQNLFRKSYLQKTARSNQNSNDSSTENQPEISTNSFPEKKSLKMLERSESFVRHFPKGTSNISIKAKSRSNAKLRLSELKYRPSSSANFSAANDDDQHINIKNLEQYEMQKKLEKLQEILRKKQLELVDIKKEKIYQERIYQSITSPNSQNSNYNNNRNRRTSGYSSKSEYSPEAETVHSLRRSSAASLNSVSSGTDQIKYKTAKVRRGPSKKPENTRKPILPTINSGENFVNFQKKINLKEEKIGEKVHVVENDQPETVRTPLVAPNSRRKPIKSKILLEDPPTKSTKPPKHVNVFRDPVVQKKPSPYVSPEISPISKRKNLINKKDQDRKPLIPLQSKQADTNLYAAAIDPDANKAVDTYKCSHCDRKFEKSRLATHRKICRKNNTNKNKRKPFDMVKQRVAGTEHGKILLEKQGFSSQSTNKNNHLQNNQSSRKVNPSNRKGSGFVRLDSDVVANKMVRSSSWRQKSADFRAMLRDARQYNKKN